MKILVTGATGQDGAYLIKSLLQKNHEVVALVRRSSNNDFNRLKLLKVNEKDFQTEYFDLCEPFNVRRVLEKTKPDQIYNLAAQSFVGSSFEFPLYTFDVNAVGVSRFLETIREVNPKIKFYQASTSEMFGKVKETPQNENTPFHPRSPYGVSKLAAHWMGINYRESYGMFVCNGILFNHESPLRGIEFVTKKIVNGFAKIAKNEINYISLGNMEATRDWGHAEDYVEAMYLMLQHDVADDYVIATGETYSIKQFVEMVAQRFDINIEWVNEGVDTLGVNNKTGKVVVATDPKFYRPAEVDCLIGDCSKAKKVLNWVPKHNIQSLVDDMVKFEKGVH